MRYFEKVAISTDVVNQAVQNRLERLNALQQNNPSDPVYKALNERTHTNLQRMQGHMNQDTTAGKSMFNLLNQTDKDLSKSKISKSILHPRSSEESKANVGKALNNFMANRTSFDNLELGKAQTGSYTLKNVVPKAGAGSGLGWKWKLGIGAAGILGGGYAIHKFTQKEDKDWDQSQMV